MDTVDTHRHKAARTDRSPSRDKARERHPRDATAGGAPESSAIGGNLPLASFRISTATAGALARQNITTLFPIQAATFDSIFDGRRARRPRRFWTARPPHA